MAFPAIDPKRTLLFVGAGVSITLRLPSWNELVAEIGRKLGFDPRIFQLLGDPLALAEYYLLKTGSVGPLRSWMDVEWHKSTIDVSASKLHENIVRAGFRKIYTTNFDRWLEKACEHWGVSYRKILRVSDIAAVAGDELEIVKFHGDFDDDDTLVLTESSYFRRLEFESPLDLMLRADALRYSILFVGYSMSDVNIRYLFHKLADLWGDTSDKSLRPKSYIFMMRPNPVAEAVFSQWGIEPIANNADKAEQGLTDFLQHVSKHVI